jgi:uncharacterized protein (TIGR03084 family)
MREILADLVAEQQSLDQMLQRIPERDWRKTTPAKPWTVLDTISHLAAFEGLARAVLTGETSLLEEARSHGDVDRYNEVGIAEGRTKRPQEVIEWWRHERASVVDALSRMRPDRRVPWVASEMSVRTLATTRLMETWAHGLDVQVALGKHAEDTARLRHVAWLGWRTLPYAFERAGESYPQPIRVELVGPGYARWVFGPEDADQVVRGSASDWCRVAVRRMKAADAENLTATGDVAEAALRVARAFL